MMDGDVALRIDGYMISLGAGFSSGAEYLRNNTSKDEQRDLIQIIGKGFGAVVELSNAQHPDTMPKELKP